MKKVKIPRIIFAAPQSSSGKTTVVLGFLAALRKRGILVKPYKIGPDYIDPLYHKLASNQIGNNLDTWLVDEKKMVKSFVDTAKNGDFSVIEGVMGLYDGGKNGISSTADLAKRLSAPIILVINCRSMGESAAAIALGFIKYDKDINIAGVILNGLGSNSHKEMIVEAMNKIGIKVLGAVMRDEQLKMPERHLGLTPTTERDASKQIDLLADKISSQLDIDEILKIGKDAPEIEFEEEEKIPFLGEVKIAIANDEAFSFYYEEGINILKSLGAKIVFFSPLNDKKLPECDGVIFGGGFPEMFSERLSLNHSMIESIREKAKEKIPIYAECGGFMYLTQAIIDFSDKEYKMVGLIPVKTKMKEKLQMVGYVSARCLNDCLLGKKGDILRGHEFHFSVQEDVEENFSWAYEFTKNRTGKQYLSGYAKDNILASYLHLHFLGMLDAAKNFINKALIYQKQKESN